MATGDRPNRGSRRPSAKRSGTERFEEDQLYESFPRGEDYGYGQNEGYNVYRRLNDRSLFTEEALADPVIAAFVDAPFSVSFLQTKSSTRESEWVLHKPHLTMAGKVEGIQGPVEKFPTDHPPHIATFFINHHRTMARWKQSTLVVEDGDDAGQMVYKEEDTSQEDPGFGL
jgi:hypothetical protein